ncbi:MAG: hypothetical protein KAU62_00805 [Candidatus Heimdallarchaeota archaeon]|nr:hypothetical protein [Candidatus Heimdallarchaeota archaeon]MCG3254587.1 hypothetical protein [Candidatus Heimdallarchaeota archaeon]MCK4609671.1 hypothetical protein [Candidatus Heimdallarchaeota archaeon]
MKTVSDEKFEAIENMFLTGRYYEALQEIDSIEQRSDITFEDRVFCYRLKTQLYCIFQPFSKAIEFGEKAVKGSVKLGNKFLIFDSAFHLGRALCLTGDLKTGVVNLQLAQDTLDSINDQETPEYLKRKAILQSHYKGWRDGFDFLLEKLTQALKIVEEIEWDYGRVNIQYELACLYQWYGKYSQAIKQFEICLELTEKFNIFEQKMGCLSSLGTIYLDMGELETSLNYLMKSLPFTEKMESAFALSFILGDIGFIHWQKHDLDKTVEYYTQCAQMLLETGNSHHRRYSWILFRLILVLLEQNKFKKTKENLEKIKAISDFQSYRKQHLSHKIYKLSKAIILKAISPENDFNEIVDLLNEVAYDSLIHNEMNKIALFHLCDMYFNRLIKSNDFEILSYIKLKINDLEKLAREQDSYVILAEALLFESQLSLLELEIDEAKLLLNDAQKIAEEKGIHRLANLISNAHDKIIENLDQWGSASLMLPDLSERLELTHIEDLLYDLVRNKLIYKDVKREEENPNAFLILGQEGTILFSEILNEASFDTNQLHPIISKIQNEEIKHECDMPIFERVRYNGYNIIKVKHGTFIFSYIFIGKSFLASRKFRKLISEVQSYSEVWRNLLPKFESKQQLVLDDRIQLSTYLQKMFLE